MDNQVNNQSDKLGSGKTVVVAFVVLVVVVSGILVYMLKSTSQKKTNTIGSSQTESINSGSQNKEDAQLDADTQKINTDITSLGADVSNIDKSLVDQPVDLSQ